MNFKPLLLLGMMLGLSGLVANAPLVQAQAQAGDCSNLLPVALIVGEFGQVSPGQSNNVRDVPSKDGTRVGQLQGGEQFEVLDGPVCVDGLVWWHIQSDAVIGWTVDGSDGEQWLVPITALTSETESPLILSTTVITPETASQLQPLRTVNCDNGPDRSSLIALGSRYVARNCGYYNINTPNISLEEQLLNDRLGIIDLESGKQVTTLSGEGNSVYPMAFLPDGHLLWFSQKETTSVIILHLSDIITGEEIATAEIDDELNTSYLFPERLGLYANNTRFALFYEVDNQYTLHRWDATTLVPQEEQIFEKPDGLSGNDMFFAISPDGERFAIIYQVENHSELAIYDTENRQPEAVIRVPFVVYNNPAYLTFSPSGNSIVGAGCRLNQLECGNSGVYWWNASDGTQIAEWDVPLDGSGRVVRFSPDNQLLLVGSTSGIVFYEVDTGEIVHVLRQDAPMAIFGADGTFIVTQGDPLTTIWIVGE